MWGSSSQPWDHMLHKLSQPGTSAFKVFNTLTNAWESIQAPNCFSSKRFHVDQDKAYIYTVTAVHSKPELLLLAYLHRGGTKWFVLCLIFKGRVKLDFKFIEYRNVSSFFRSKCNCSQNCQKLGVMNTSSPCCRLSVTWGRSTPPQFQHVLNSKISVEKCLDLIQCTRYKASLWFYFANAIYFLCQEGPLPASMLLIHRLPSDHIDEDRVSPSLSTHPKQLLNTYISHRSSSVVKFQVVFCLSPILHNEIYEGRDWIIPATGIVLGYDR